jgi:predicted O-methyltransferase YrrM
VKQLLKDIFPVPVLNAARKLRDDVGIYTVPKQTFDVSPLRGASSLSLGALFADLTIGAACEEDHEAIRVLFQGARGSVNLGDRRALYHIVGHLRPQSVLEVGTHVGGSALYIGRVLKRLGAARKLTTVDILDVNDATVGPWKNVGLPMPPVELVRRLDCANIVDFRTEASLDFMRKTAERFDLVYLDGDMASYAVYGNVAAALRVLNPNGVILLHAYYPSAMPLGPDKLVHRGPFYAMARITRENPSITTLPLGNLPWPTRRGSHASSLAFVVRR